MNFITLFSLKTLNSAAFDASDRRFFDSRYAPSVLYLTGCSYFVFFQILNFCIDRPFAFSAYQDNHFLLDVSNFCLDRPFRISVHRDAHFCLSRPYGFSTYRAVLIILDKVFLDYIRVYSTWKFFTIHGLKSHGTTRESSFYNIRAFIVRRPLAPGVRLECHDLF